MFKYITQNKNIIMVAVALFIVSMSTLMFFIGNNNELKHSSDFKADIIDVMKMKSPEEQEKKYRELAHNEKDSIVVLNLENSVEFMSADLESSLGYTQDEIAHQPFYKLIHPEDLAIYLGGFGQVLKTQQTVNVVGPYRMRNKNSDYQMHIATAVPSLEENKVTHIILVIRDISESMKDKPRSNEKKIKNQSNNSDARLMAEKINL